MSSRTLERWVSDILQKTGTHTKTFKTHSLRLASTSNAFSGGLSLTKITKTAGRTNKKTFHKFYNKPFIDNNFGNFSLTNSLQLYPYFRYCMLKIDTCMMYVILNIYQFGMGGEPTEK